MRDIIAARARRAASLACAVAVFVASAVLLAPGAHAVTIPSPAPPTSYSNTTACVSANNAGAKLTNGVSWAQTQLDYTSMWRLAGRGADQKIAVIDTGVNEESAFGDRLHAGGDYVVKDGTGLDDCDGHGTVVAGIIAATPDPASGFAGVAPDAELISIRQSSGYYGVKDAKQGSADRVAGTTTTLAEAIMFAVSAGAKIINISEASCSNAGAETDSGVAAVQAAVDYAVANDAVIIAAAGNVDSSTDCKTQNTPGKDPQTLPTPADLPGVLTVAAADQTGQPAPFSLSGTWVDVAAPGVNIIATNPVRGTTGQINEFITQAGVSTIQGTSFAAPYVTGLVALVRARFPDLSALKVIDRIERTAEHPAAPGGRNDFVGYGMINPQAALTTALPGEDGTTPTPRSGPAALPAAQPHPDRERNARLVALIGSLALLVVAVSGGIAMSTRRRRADSLARSSALRTAAAGRRRG